jgi:uroporphyrinogen decarboxylase
MREATAAVMKIIGGVGNGVFECVRDITGFVDLCYIISDDPDFLGYCAFWLNLSRTK